MPSLCDALSTMLIRLWPARRHQELLLDLGERKAWTATERLDAVGRVAGWLTSELIIAETMAAGRPETVSPAALPDVSLDGVERVPGVGLRTAALARLVGAEPKTLANTLGRPLRSDRRDHRWLLFLQRLEREEVNPSALVFHRRSPDSVSAELARGPCRAAPDAGDALLLMSLVALWQRRRPTDDARAVRGADVARRAVPKPAAAMKWDLVTLAQVRPLIDHALHREGTLGRHLAAVVLEATLTEAHFAPHRPRYDRGQDDEGERWGDHWLRAADAILDDTRVAALLGDLEVSVFRWRVARMRAYASRAPTPAPEPVAGQHPYVQLATSIDDVRAGMDGTRRFAAREPGYLMLLPQARRLGLIEST